MPPPTTTSATHSELNNELKTQDKSNHIKAYTLPGKPFALFSTLPYYIYYLVYLSGFFFLYYVKNPYIMIFILYVVFPLIDSYSSDWLNPDREQYKLLENDFKFLIPLTGLVLVDNITTVYAIWYFTTQNLPWFYYPGALYLAGSFAGHQFLVAHELFHKRNKFHKFVGVATIFKNLYLHYYIEHTMGHHKHIGTPHDPTTARYGESLFQYIPRVVSCSYISAWNIEKKRLTQFKGHKTHWVIQNQMIWFTASYVIPPTLAFYFLGLKGLIIYSIIMLLSVIILETVDYIEHYGLVRKEIAPGEYEKVNVTHSWNAPHRLSNYILFKLERHSDHHENAYKPYQALCSYDDSPTLPQGYFFCIILASTPSVWFRIMDRTLKAYRERRPLTQEEDRLNRKDTNGMLLTNGVVLVTFSVLTYIGNQFYYN
jgi:alkane 1-monooxygenase